MEYTYIPLSYTGAYLPWDLSGQAKFHQPWRNLPPPPPKLTLYEIHHFPHLAFKSHTIQHQKQGISKAGGGGGWDTPPKSVRGGGDMSLPPPQPRYASGHIHIFSTNSSQIHRCGSLSPGSGSLLLTNTENRSGSDLFPKTRYGSCFNHLLSVDSDPGFSLDWI